MVRRAPALALVVALVAALALAGCSSDLVDRLDGSSDSDSDAGQTPGTEDDESAEPEEEAPTKPRLSLSTGRGDPQVAVDHRVVLRAHDGRFARVRVRTPEHGELAGRIVDDGARWRANGRLEPGATYTVVTALEGAENQRVERRARFTTQDLPLDQQTYPSIAPLDGETVGVGMPVVVQFDVPVSDRAAIEKHLNVRSQPKQAGSWHWVSDHEVRWRPREYWRPGTEVTVEADINSIPAGGGVYGQLSRSIDFTVGESHVYRVDARSHTMEVYAGGERIRTLPITTGKDGFTTRSGVKVVMEKHDTYDMNSSTIGINPEAAEGYDLEDVAWAMRLTYSGEFIHAAPWSTGAQGSANVSHGCTGMSPADARWLYQMTRRGDVVEYVGTDRGMTAYNGWGDWNLSFADYRAGSALS